MRFIASVFALILSSTESRAQVTATNDPTQWQNAVGSYCSILFTDYPEFTVITDQYDDLGITFIDGNDFILVSAFPTDDYGLSSTDGFGNLGTIHISFTEPQYWIALDFLGNVQLEFYDHGQLFFTSSNYVSGFTPFVGFVSIMPFDEVVILDNDDPTVAIDNIYFGPPIPAPGALALFGLAAGVALRRRTRS